MNDVMVEEKSFSMLGGQLCLDFANTVGARDGGVMRDHIRDYADLVLWSKQAGALDERTVQNLLEEAEEFPAEANEVLIRAVALREAIYQIFSALSAGQQPRPQDLVTLNAELSQAMSRARIVHTSEGFEWDWMGGEFEMERVLWPIARSAADLLTSGDLGRVRECAGEMCGWLFVDTSRNHSRRWCDMSDCGNRAKARRHYEKKKTGPLPPMS